MTVSEDGIVIVARAHVHQTIRLRLGSITSCAYLWKDSPRTLPSGTWALLKPLGEVSSHVSIDFEPRNLQSKIRDLKSSSVIGHFNGPFSLGVMLAIT